MSRWEFRGLAASLPGFSLGPLDLLLEPGRVVAVVGRSGAGKTTLLRTVAGFVPLTAGRILRDGVEISGTPAERRKVGFVPQGFGLFPHRTVAQNVRYPLELRHASDAAEAAGRLLRRFGIEELARRRPTTLSAGQAQKVAVARALASQPDLLAWDEPAHALDVEARDELVAIFRETAREDGVPLLLVTHDPLLAFTLADRFLLLEGGRAPFAGDARTLVDQPPDAFTARFAGFENLFARPQLESRAGPFTAWLLGRAGPQGAAFPSIPLGTAAPGAWDAIVEAVRPGPDGLAIDLVIESLRLRGRASWKGPAAQLSPGERIRFDLDPGDVRALGGSVGTGPGAP